MEFCNYRVRIRIGGGSIGVILDGKVVGIINRHDIVHEMDRICVGWLRVKDMNIKDIDLGVLQGNGGQLYPVAPSSTE